jgi:hypothetical protein
LETLHPDWPLPARQVLHKHFVSEGLVKKRRRSLKRPHPGRPTAPFDAPNSVWSADFKGHFKTRDGLYCYPLTVQDGFSRYLLACQGLGGTIYSGTRRVFSRLFQEFGLSQIIGWFDQGAMLPRAEAELAMRRFAEHVMPKLV